MAFGLVLIAISSTFAGLAFSYWVLLAVRVVEGIGSAFYVTSSVALLAKVAPRERRGQYMSYYVAALLLGGISGPAVGGYVALYFGLAAPFFFYALAASAALAMVVLFLPVEPPQPQKASVTLAEVRTILKNPSFVLVNLGALAAFSSGEVSTELSFPCGPKRSSASTRGLSASF